MCLLCMELLSSSHTDPGRAINSFQRAKSMYLYSWSKNWRTTESQIFHFSNFLRQESNTERIFELTLWLCPWGCPCPCSLEIRAALLASIRIVILKLPIFLRAKKTRTGFLQIDNRDRRWRWACCRAYCRSYPKFGWRSPTRVGKGCSRKFVPYFVLNFLKIVNWRNENSDWIFEKNQSW